DRRLSRQVRIRGVQSPQVGADQADPAGFVTHALPAVHRKGVEAGAPVVLTPDAVCHRPATYERKLMPGVQDRVIVVTGAGGGLGREYALTLAKEGASVVVNDLGGARDGTGSGSAMADQVVAEIKDAGGRAGANYDSVAEAEGAGDIVKTALDGVGARKGGGSNAGILRDGTFHKMPFENWDAVLKVHLYGGYNVIRAAWPHFREQSFGRVVVATSTSGLFGNFGQANYSAAKLGLVGLINTLAQ